MFWWDWFFGGDILIWYMILGRLMVDGLVYVMW